MWKIGFEVLIKAPKPIESSRATVKIVLETTEGILKLVSHLLIDRDTITQKEK